MFTNVLFNALYFFQAGAGLSITKLLENVKNSTLDIGALVLAAVGAGVFIYSVIGIAMNFFKTGNRGQAHWGMKLVGLVVGGSLMTLGVGNLGIWKDIADGGNETLEELAKGTSTVLVQSVEKPAEPVLVEK